MACLALIQVEEDEPSDFVRFDKFQPVMTKIMTERRYRPSTEEQLVKAFEVSRFAFAALRPWVCVQTSVASEWVLYLEFDRCRHQAGCHPHSHVGSSLVHVLEAHVAVSALTEGSVRATCHQQSSNKAGCFPGVVKGPAIRPEAHWGAVCSHWLQECQSYDFESG